MSEYELSVTRHIAAPPEAVYRVWHERFEEWFTPAPWTTESIEQDLQAGGRSALIMRGPAGEEAMLEGVYLEVVPNRLIISTDAYQKGWVPRQPFMTSVYSFEPEDGGTRYTAAARHWTPEDYKKHKEMGFEEGWGTVADQFKLLVEAVFERA
jgi:uncharacterized protein YndB with AHSA1/START domain